MSGDPCRSFHAPHARGPMPSLSPMRDRRSLAQGVQNASIAARQGRPSMTIPSTSALVRNFERFMSLTPAEREHLERLSARTKTVEPRRKLIVQGKPCGQQMVLLLDGWLIESRYLRDGKRQILNLRLPGDVVGIECLAYKSALHSTAALSRCTVAPFPTEMFARTQRDFPRLAATILLMTLREGAIRAEWEVNLGRRAAFARIAHLLLELDCRLHQRGLALTDQVPFPLTQEELADCTGLTLPYVNRILQQMRHNGMIRLDDALEIRDRPALEAASKFVPDYLDGSGRDQSPLIEALALHASSLIDVDAAPAHGGA